MGRHYVSLCAKKGPAITKIPNPVRPIAPSAAHLVGSANVASCNNSLGPDRPSSAALQTAQAVVNGSDKVMVSVLFDSGSQKSFVTPGAVESAQLQVVRTEDLGIKAFGSERAEGKRRDVVENELREKSGGKRVKI